MNPTAPQFKIGINIVNDAANGNTCELYFMDAIYNKVNFWTGEEQSMLAEVIKQVNESKPTKIIQYIDSWGGSAPVGFGIYNYLKSHTAKVETKILNNCASIATVMSAAGNKGKIGMPRNGMMVIHQAQNSARGTSAELREAADVCDKYTESVLDVYVQTNRKGKTRDELYNCIKDGDYWMTGQEALDMGFVDYIYNDASITVSNSIAKAKLVYNNIPQHILDMAEAEIPAQEESGIFTKIKNYFDMKVTEIKAAFDSKLPTNGVIGTGEHALDIKALLAPSIEAMLEAVNAAMTAEIAEAVTNATTTVIEGVTAVETKYKELLDAISEKVKNLTDSVGKLTETINEQAAIITTQKEAIDKHDTTITAHVKDIKDLSADVERAAGRPVAAAGNEADAATPGANANKKPKLTFAGKTTPVNVSD